MWLLDGMWPLARMWLLDGIWLLDRMWLLDGMWLLDARRVSAHSGGQETPVMLLLFTVCFTFEN